MYKGFILKFGDLAKTLSLEKCYYAAMCLYNMVDNNTEMKKHKIPKITYGKESC